MSTAPIAELPDPGPQGQDFRTYGAIIDAMADTWASPAAKPAAVSVAVMIDGEIAFRLDRTDAYLAPGLGKQASVVGGLATALALIIADPGPLAG